jgi:hypothetical protein
MPLLPHEGCNTMTAISTVWARHHHSRGTAPIETAGVVQRGQRCP